MQALPSTVRAYKRTCTFTPANTPKGLLNKHNTKRGTWGLIHVTKGRLLYTLFARNAAGVADQDIGVELDEATPGVIEPQVFHKVTRLTDNAEFYVEFFAEQEGDIQAPRFINKDDIVAIEPETA
eukprot:TRINITY_DN6575_c0_g1_i1.p1 TRINITY_DN6575_c0_g1~~TRINITY_DN6575_c0_g1_i1.p1  ORF type:complete len:125 (-),score=23.03 TRINITY_DN6575_c0_g1_i1:78-452(-)